MYNCNNCTTCGDCHKTPIQQDNPPLFCMHCNINNAYCLKACKNKAIHILGGAITRDDNKCIKCRDCIEVCPIDILNI